MDRDRDRRNVQDEYRGLSLGRIVELLGDKRLPLEVAIENLERDFSVGTIIRSANNFNVAKVHILGKKKCNLRGAMCTDKYLEVVYWNELEDFFRDQRMREREVVAIENHDVRVRPLVNKKFIQRTTLLFGSEGNGLTEATLKMADDVREIESFGSTRSVNVAVAAGIAMYEWVRQCVLNGGGDG